VHTAEYVLEDVNLSPAAVKPHLATFSPPISPSVIGHADQFSRCVPSPARPAESSVLHAPTSAETRRSAACSPTVSEVGTAMQRLTSGDILKTLGRA
jgi:hypothetical protein